MRAVYMDDLKFKYRDASERTLNVIRNREIYFSPPESLNDPLDSQINIDKEYQRVVEMFPRNHSEEYLRKAFLIYLLNKHDFPGRDGKQLGLNGALQWFLSRLGIFSLSLTPIDALLWSHYGGSHMGVALGFDTNLIADERVFIRNEILYSERPQYQRVFLELAEKLGEFVRPWESDCEYSDELGDNFYTHQISQLMRANLLYKSDKWSYEKEYRLISNRAGLCPFPAEALKTVVVGLKTDLEFVNKLQSILSVPEYSHVELLYVQHLAGSYDFELVKYHDSLMRLDLIT